MILTYFSGYGSQVVSSNTLSSDDSMSLRSISVDDTPDTEIGPKIGADDLKKVTTVPVVPQNVSTDLLSPPDISLTSISPGEETDATVTITPSSATITPSQSTEMGKKKSNSTKSYLKAYFSMKPAKKIFRLLGGKIGPTAQHCLNGQNSNSTATSIYRLHILSTSLVLL